MDSFGRAYATGGRKTSTARVWVWRCRKEGEGLVRVNGQSLSEYFGGHWGHRHAVISPFLKTNTAGIYGVKATVKGGGITGQAEAIRHGIATAIQGLDMSLRPVLKKAGFLTRDARRSERKKPGQAGARKKFAWVKR